jgi:predicted permease
MPASFRFPIASSADLWMVVRDDQFNPALRNRRDARLIEVMARLRPGVTVEQAQADMEAIAGGLRREYPATNAEIGVRVVPAIDQVTGTVATALWLLLGAVGCVLAIACANVANLLLARAVRRRPELLVRTALGASRSRLVRQLGLECVPLALAGGALGGLLSIWALQALAPFLPPDLPRADEIGVDLRVLAYAVAASLVSLMTVALVPAWHAATTAEGSALQHGSGTSSPAPRWRSLLDVLVIAQIAIAMILVTGAALLVNSFARLSEDAPGYDPQGVLTFRLDWPTPIYRPIAAAQAFEAVQERLEKIPGVQAASIGLQLPDRGEPMLDRDLPFVEVEGRPVAPGARPRTSMLTVQPGYFRALGIPLVRGRAFDAGDGPGRPVVVINESLARAVFGDGDPVGWQLRLDGWTFLGQRSAEIVGVAAAVTHRHLGAEATPLVYLPLAQNPVSSAYVVVKTSGNPLRVVDAVRDAVRAVDPDQPIDDLQTLEQRLAGSLARDRFSTWVLGLFAVIALVLATGGLYAVLAYAVEQRRQELGIRVTLGARTADVLGLVLRHGVRVTGAGIAAGVGGGLALSRVIERLLFGVSSTDPLTFAAAALVLGATGLLACWIPARQATKVDPLVALRH